MNEQNTVELAVQKRLYIGGLHPDVSIQDIKNRFVSYGTVDDIQIAHDSFPDGKTVLFFL